MKVLVFGPSGSGKTYISQALQKSGINAYDSDYIEGLSAWYNKQGKKVEAPATANEAIVNHYAFLWDRQFLKKFLAQFKDVYLFGGSGNVFNMIDLFDKTYFLKIDLQTQKNRLLKSRKESAMDFSEGEIIVWGDWLEQEAIKRNISFIDASLSPKDILNVISRN